MCCNESTQVVGTFFLVLSSRLLRWNLVKVLCDFQRQACIIGPWKLTEDFRNCKHSNIMDLSPLYTMFMSTL